MAATSFYAYPLLLLSGLGSAWVPQWRHEVTGLVAEGAREFVALEPALGGRGDVGRGVGLESVFDLGGDQVTGSGDRQRGGLDFFSAASSRLRTTRR